MYSEHPSMQTLYQSGKNKNQLYNSCFNPLFSGSNGHFDILISEERKINVSVFRIVFLTISVVMETGSHLICCSASNMRSSVLIKYQHVSKKLFFFALPQIITMIFSLYIYIYILVSFFFLLLAEEKKNYL